MFISRKDLDVKKWDALVLESKASIFSTSIYLDAVADNWLVYWEVERDFAFALPFTEKMGVKTLYQPFFSRYQELIGDSKYFSERLSETIKQMFPRSLISFKNKLAHLKFTEEYVYQSIDYTHRKVSTLAKRSIKKFEKESFKKCDTTITDLNHFISTELSKKLDFYKSNNTQKLNNLVVALDKNGYLTSLQIAKENKLVGGVMFMTFGTHTIYLKGVCQEDVMKLGGMYYLLDTLINLEEENKRTFDFGGSRIDGVRNFNKKLGGIDVKYYAYHWDNSPFWFKLAQRIKKWIKK